MQLIISTYSSASSPFIAAGIEGEKDCGVELGMIVILLFLLLFAYIWHLIVSFEVEVWNSFDEAVHYYICCNFFPPKINDSIHKLSSLAVYVFRHSMIILAEPVLIFFGMLIHNCS